MVEAIRAHVKQSRRAFVGSVVATATAWLTHPGLVFSQSERSPTIYLGQSAPLTGPLAKSAIAFRDAAKAAFDDLNARGGISGRLVKLVSLDDQARSEVTATNVKLLASQQSLVGLFGFMGPGAHRIGAVSAQQEGLPYIAPVSGATELRSSNMPQGWELRDAFSKRARAVGLSDVALVSVDQSGSDFSIKDAVTVALQEKPHGIVLGADYAASGKFVRAARSAGFSGMFYALSTVGGRALMDQIDIAAGISVTQVVSSLGQARRR